MTQWISVERDAEDARRYRFLREMAVRSDSPLERGELENFVRSAALDMAGNNSTFDFLVDQSLKELPR